jgi:Coenzyme PQQ synthesis protein D (PqqD)
VLYDSDMEVGPAVTYRRNPVVVFQHVDDRVMMMNPERAEFVTVSPTGAQVWDALEAPGTAEDIMQRLLPKWPGVDPEQMLKDIDAFLVKLEEAGAVFIEK